MFNEAGARIGLYVNGTAYMYDFNVQGDVVAIRNSAGTILARYTYDAWGNPISVTDASGNAITSPTHIANLNSFRYRGYYYDNETGFYYLQSRYYDPAVGRFINADTILGANTDAAGYNLFAYCGNNPVNRVDPTGHDWDWLDNFWGLYMTEDQKRKSANAKYGTPIYGEPNSWLHIPGNNGNDVDRWFGPDGKADYDVHWGHPDHHGYSPHTEDWVWNGNSGHLDPGTARPYDPEKDGTPPGAPVPSPKFEFKLPELPQFNPPTGDSSPIVKFIDSVKSFFNKLFS